MNEKQTKLPTTMKQTIISVIGPSGCGKSQYINPIVRRLINNGYTVHAPSLIESKLSRYLESVDSDAQFVILHVGSNFQENRNMRIEFYDMFGPMNLMKAFYRKHTPSIPIDDDLDEPLGPACSRENPECEACQ